MSEFQGCEIPEDLYYDVENYAWARPEEDGSVTVGISDPTQTLAGKILHVSFNEKRKKVAHGKHIAVLESGKWVGGVPSPVDGEILRFNTILQEEPHLLNIAPYTDAWIARIKPDHPEEDLKRLVTGREAVEKISEWIKRYEIQCIRCME